MESQQVLVLPAVLDAAGLLEQVAATALPRDIASMPDREAILQGYLKKQSGPDWKRRYFVLYKDRLEWSAKQDPDTTAVGPITPGPARGFGVLSIRDITEIAPDVPGQNVACGFRLGAGGKTFLLQAPLESARRHWLTALAAVMIHAHQSAAQARLQDMRRSRSSTAESQPISPGIGGDDMRSPVRDLSELAGMPLEELAATAKSDAGHAGAGHEHGQGEDTPVETRPGNSMDSSFAASSIGSVPGRRGSLSSRAGAAEPTGTYGRGPAGVSDSMLRSGQTSRRQSFSQGAPPAGPSPIPYAPEAGQADMVTPTGVALGSSAVGGAGAGGVILDPAAAALAAVLQAAEAMMASSSRIPSRVPSDRQSRAPVPEGSGTVLARPAAGPRGAAGSRGPSRRGSLTGEQAGAAAANIVVANSSNSRRGSLSCLPAGRERSLSVQSGARSTGPGPSSGAAASASRSPRTQQSPGHGHKLLDQILGSAGLSMGDNNSNSNPGAGRSPSIDELLDLQRRLQAVAAQAEAKAAEQREAAANLRRQAQTEEAAPPLPPRGRAAGPPSQAGSRAPSRPGSRPASRAASVGRNGASANSSRAASRGRQAGSRIPEPPVPVPKPGIPRQSRPQAGATTKSGWGSTSAVGGTVDARVRSRTGSLASGQDATGDGYDIMRAGSGHAESIGEPSDDDWQGRAEEQLRELGHGQGQAQGYGREHGHGHEEEAEPYGYGSEAYGSDSGYAASLGGDGREVDGLHGTRVARAKSRITAGHAGQAGTKPPVPSRTGRLPAGTTSQTGAGRSRPSSRPASTAGRSQPGSRAPSAPPSPTLGPSQAQVQPDVPAGDAHGKSGAASSATSTACPPSRHRLEYSKAWVNALRQAAHEAAITSLGPSVAGPAPTPLALVPLTGPGMKPTKVPLAQEFTTGMLLVHVLEAATPGLKIEGVARRPRARPAFVSNNEAAMRHVWKAGVKSSRMPSAEELADGAKDDKIAAFLPELYEAVGLRHARMAAHAVPALRWLEGLLRAYGFGTSPGLPVGLQLPGCLTDGVGTSQAGPRWRGLWAFLRGGVALACLVHYYAGDAAQDSGLEGAMDGADLHPSSARLDLGQVFVGQLALSRAQRKSNLALACGGLREMGAKTVLTPELLLGVPPVGAGAVVHGPDGQPLDYSHEDEDDDAALLQVILAHEALGKRPGKLPHLGLSTSATAAHRAQVQASSASGQAPCVGVVTLPGGLSGGEDGGWVTSPGLDGARVAVVGHAFADGPAPWGTARGGISPGRASVPSSPVRPSPVRHQAASSAAAPVATGLTPPPVPVRQAPSAPVPLPLAPVLSSPPRNTAAVANIPATADVSAGVVQLQPSGSTAAGPALTLPDILVERNRLYGVASARGLKQPAPGSGGPGLDPSVVHRVSVAWANKKVKEWLATRACDVPLASVEAYLTDPALMPSIHSVQVAPLPGAVPVPGHVPPVSVAPLMTATPATGSGTGIASHGPVALLRETPVHMLAQGDQDHGTYSQPPALGAVPEPVAVTARPVAVAAVVTASTAQPNVSSPVRPSAQTTVSGQVASPVRQPAAAGTPAPATPDGAVVVPAASPAPPSPAEHLQVASPAASPMPAPRAVMGTSSPAAPSPLAQAAALPVASPPTAATPAKFAVASSAQPQPQATPPQEHAPYDDQDEEDEHVGVNRSRYDTSVSFGSDGLDEDGYGQDDGHAAVLDHSPAKAQSSVVPQAKPAPASPQPAAVPKQSVLAASSPILQSPSKAGPTAHAAPFLLPLSPGEEGRLPTAPVIPYRVTRGWPADAATLHAWREAQRSAMAVEEKYSWERARLEAEEDEVEIRVPLRGGLFAVSAKTQPGKIAPAVALPTVVSPVPQAAASVPVAKSAASPAPVPAGAPVVVAPVKVAQPQAAAPAPVALAGSSLATAALAAMVPEVASLLLGQGPVAGPAAPDQAAVPVPAPVSVVPAQQAPALVASPVPSVTPAPAPAPAPAPVSAPVAPAAPVPVGLPAQMFAVRLRAGPRTLAVKVGPAPGFKGEQAGPSDLALMWGHPAMQVDPSGQGPPALGLARVEGFVRLVDVASVRQGVDGGPALAPGGQQASLPGFSVRISATNLAATRDTGGMIVVDVLARPGLAGQAAVDGEAAVTAFGQSLAKVHATAMAAGKK